VKEIEATVMSLHGDTEMEFCRYTKSKEKNRMNVSEEERRQRRPLRQKDTTEDVFSLTSVSGQEENSLENSEEDAEVAMLMTSALEETGDEVPRAATAEEELRLQATRSSDRTSPGKTPWQDVNKFGAPVRRPQSALGQQMFAEEKVLKKCIKPAPDRWRTPKKDYEYGKKFKNKTPDSNIYGDGYSFGMADGRKDATQFNAKITTMRDFGLARAVDFTPPPGYNAPDFLEEKKLEAYKPRSPTIRKTAVLAMVKIREAKHEAAAKRKRLLEDAEREEQLKIIMLRDAKYGGEASTKLSQKFYLKSLILLRSLKYMGTSIMEGRKLKGLMLAGHNAANVICRCWRRYTRKRLATKYKRRIYALRSLIFRMNIHYRVKRKEQAAQKIIWLVLETGKLTECSRRFQAFRFLLVKIQRWWRNRVKLIDYLILAPSNSWQQWDMEREQAAADAKRGLFPKVEKAPEQYRKAVLKERLHERRKKYLQQWRIWSEGIVLPTMRYNNGEDKGNTILKAILRAETKEEKEALHRQCTPKLSIIYSDEEMSEMHEFAIKSAEVDKKKRRKIAKGHLVHDLHNVKSGIHMNHELRDIEAFNKAL